ncbi:protein transporter Sec31 [Streptomyces sp. NBC_00233]|uniref:protein transporter Sec31 n=1 Tax=Streptomyces sp. NBC_00233 TaxID=2975686 RepID=UPI0022550AEC|nr:protein transporter Sec31 [Streptomyces sp. NBC_00233]MCX5229693.1 protein transporter Sec31 [Streptomyces sp. NBC_00233]
MRTRTERRERLVPHTIDGKTVLVKDPYDIHVPRPPRDWDQIVRSGVTTVAGGIAAASIIWTTSSIGALFDRATNPAAAYAAAAVFDLAWIACMALEWLARFDPDRASLPRRAGWGALVIAMVAVVVEGDATGQLVAGLVGATVSGLAKLLWTLVLRHYATPLDSRTQQWVDAQRAEAGVRRAMVPIRRELARAEGAVAAEEAALRTDPDPRPDSPDEPEDGPDADIVPIARILVTAKDAVRDAWDSGLRDEDQILRTASAAHGRPISEDTVSRYVRALKVGA